MTSSEPAAPVPSAPSTSTPPTAAAAPDRSSAPSSGAPSVPVPSTTGRLQVDGLQPVSAKLIPARYIGGIIGYLIGIAAVIACVVLAIRFDWWWMHLIALLPLILVLQGLLLTPRRVRAIGWREGDEELVIATGILFRSLQTVPFGRIQSVEISEGPVERRYGIASLEISTAAAGTSTTLPGLPREDAERLRQRLIDRGIATMAAL